MDFRPDDREFALIHHAAWAGNPDVVEKLVNDYGAALDVLTKDGRTALQVAKAQKQKSAEQMLQLLAKEANGAKRKPEAPPGGGGKKPKLGEATEETSDVFGAWPTPMTGNGTGWFQFLALFKADITSLHSALGKTDDVKQLEVATVLRTAVRILDGRNKLKQLYKQLEKEETKKWKEANGEPDTAAKKKALEKALEKRIKDFLKDGVPEALKVHKRHF